MTGEIDEEARAMARDIDTAVDRKDMVALLGIIAENLFRSARAQEALVLMAKQDLENQIEAEVQGRAETLAQAIEDEKSKRSFIGRR